MPKCLECGFEAQRLQWTHFKYKCTGKFKNGKEYQAAYPGSEVVDEELSKKSKFTFALCIEKYGEEEGKIRWKSYQNRQAFSNTFKYKQEKYGWTREQFDEYNSSRAVTLKNMIKRHGEELGIIKWQEYCERQGYTNTKEYFIEKYGKDTGLKKYLEINRKKADWHDPRVISEKLGITLDDAVSVILDRVSSGRRFLSNLEEEFTYMLEVIIGPLEYVSARRPYGKWSHLLDSYVVYDIKHKNCIVEFNGDYWHANPKFYLPTASVRGNLAVDIWNSDMLKLKTAESFGFKTYVVWENDFLTNKQETVDKVAKWILQEQQ